MVVVAASASETLPRSMGGARMKIHQLGKHVVRAGVILAMMTSGVVAVHSASDGQFPYVNVSEVTQPPIGWVEFCASDPAECATAPTTPRDVVLTPKAFKYLVQINKWVNDTIKPMTDLVHWGVIERWSYPDDGYGDCEYYVLLKRRLLMSAGWPREALLITVVSRLVSCQRSPRRVR
jgi:predicted transglutaminase-like cysteine proteinase